MNPQAGIFQVGGSLAPDSPCYVERRADDELFEALLAGELCYVFNSRQMGKSSLQVRTRHRLENLGARCASCDLTRIGAANIRAEQWYAGFSAELCRGFRVKPDGGFLGWWKQRDHLSPISRVSELVEEVILPGSPDGDLVIFLDEIENSLSLPFSIDDFFAWIRFCTNERGADPRYRRLTFALFGVVTPGELIRDSSQTPFNVGRAVDLAGLRRAEAEKLTAGLAGLGPSPGALLDAVLDWTAGQPFLTQKLCRLVAGTGSQPSRTDAAELVKLVVERDVLSQ
ncbi:MAG: hypothetical protein GY856_37505, partial [bacterium]|nr:hypothetical protein [bacterium]